VETNRLFRGFSAEEIKNVATLCASRVLEEGERLMREGEANSSLFLLDQGCVRFYRRRAGYQPQLLKQLEAGSFFGEVSVLDGEPALYDAVAAGAGSIRVIRQQALLELLTQESPVTFKLLRNLLGVVVERSRELDERFALFAGNVSLLRRYNN
jgi:CRP-like cAMP-binding protein